MRTGGRTRRPTPWSWSRTTSLGWAAGPGASGAAPAGGPSPCRSGTRPSLPTRPGTAPNAPARPRASGPGGGPIKARRVDGGWWSVPPAHTLVLVTDHKAPVGGGDEGIWGRLRLVPFNVTFWNPDVPPKPGEYRPERLRQDKGLLAKLMAES